MKTLLLPSLLGLFLVACFLFLAVPTAQAQQCYVCDTNWRLASNTGECPKEKKPDEIPGCKNSDDSTFGGCTGGDAVAGEKCGAAAEEDKLGTAGRGLFSPDNCAKLIPYGETGVNVSDEGKCAEFFEAISNPAGEIPLDAECKAKGITNPLEFLIGLFKKLANLFKGGIGTFQTIYPSGEEAPSACGDDVPQEFDKGAKDLEDSLVPAM